MKRVRLVLKVPRYTTPRQCGNCFAWAGWMFTCSRADVAKVIR